MEGVQVCTVPGFQQPTRVSDYAMDGFEAWKTVTTPLQQRYVETFRGLSHLHDARSSTWKSPTHFTIINLSKSYMLERYSERDQ